MGRKEHGRDEKHSRRDRRKKKGGIISTVILIVAICVFAFSAFQLYKIFNGYHKGESEYDDLVKLAVTEDKGEQENGTDDQDGSRFSVDFDALRQINPDVVFSSGSHLRLQILLLLPSLYSSFILLPAVHLP